MRDLGPAIELIWWDPDTDRYRWTYRRAGVHRYGQARTWNQAAEQLLSAHYATATPKLPVRRPAGAVDRARYRLD